MKKRPSARPSARHRSSGGTVSAPDLPLTPSEEIDAFHGRLAIKELEESRPSWDAVNRFLSSHQFPLVEGPSVTFVWRGEAEAVNLRHWVFGLESSQALSRIEEK